ncbi:hypothetical protein MUN89_15555 [Halobacillus salinarum]|uniref:DUF5673 domain-containing protein n=1 Tax=Halobacillus salinarum TaxID=2932257 RepID=A0ABY4EFS9_9BACI|nr:hypothetical protein [Halobacillus salinarum]UOQ43326.1 hypothetical protein MUN89_15555 [Halobacillus salinarum]
MSITYSNTYFWKKKAREAALNALMSMGILLFSIFINNRVSESIVYMTGLAVLISVWRMLHYWKMPEREYISFKEHSIVVRLGILDPKLQLSNEEIKNIQQVDDVCKIRTEKGEIEDIFLDYVSEQDAEIIINEFNKRYSNRMEKRREDLSG